MFAVYKIRVLFLGLFVLSIPLLFWGVEECKDQNDLVTREALFSFKKNTVQKNTGPKTVNSKKHSKPQSQNKEERWIAPLDLDSLVNPYGLSANDKLQVHSISLQEGMDAEDWFGVNLNPEQTLNIAFICSGDASALLGAHAVLWQGTDEKNQKNIRCGEFKTWQIAERDSALTSSALTGSTLTGSALTKKGLYRIKVELAEGSKGVLQYHLSIRARKSDNPVEVSGEAPEYPSILRGEGFAPWDGDSIAFPSLAKTRTDEHAIEHEVSRRHGDIEDWFGAFVVASANENWFIRNGLLCPDWDKKGLSPLKAMLFVDGEPLYDAILTCNQDFNRNVVQGEAVVPRDYVWRVFVNELAFHDDVDRSFKFFMN